MCTLHVYNVRGRYPGSDVAVLFDWRGEDSGPNVNSADDVLKVRSLSASVCVCARARARVCVCLSLSLSL